MTAALNGPAVIVGAEQPGSPPIMFDSLPAELANRHMTDLEPLAVYDVHGRSWARLDSELIAKMCNWLREHGVEPDDTTRVEIWETGHLYARIFQFDRDERGRGYCHLDHDHLASTDKCEPARREPFDVPIEAMPPIRGTRA